jgi:hypothetical protein
MTPYENLERLAKNAMREGGYDEHSLGEDLPEVILKLLEDLKVMKKALEYYAERSDHIIYNSVKGPIDIIEDGSTARAALEKIQEE